MPTLRNLNLYVQFSCFSNAYLLRTVCASANIHKEGIPGRAMSADTKCMCPNGIYRGILIDVAAVARVLMSSRSANVDSYVDSSLIYKNTSLLCNFNKLYHSWRENSRLWHGAMQPRARLLNLP